MRNFPVISRMIKNVYFSPEDGQLRICFKNGEERRFAGVPEAEVLSMCQAPSPGHHYIAHVRTRFKRLAA